MRSIVHAFGLAATLALTLGPAAAQDPAVVEAALGAGDAEAGKRVFRQCMACHQVGENARTRVGPPLNGVVGAPMGHVEGYSYSAPFMALADAGGVWDIETLTAYLESPMTMVSGGKMAYPGLRDPEDIANVIAYMAQYSTE